MMKILLMLMNFAAPPARAQAFPAWLGPRQITVEVLSDAGRSMGPRVEIKRGDRVSVRHFQRDGFERLRAANEHLTRAPDREAVDHPSTEDKLWWARADFERQAARAEAYDFEWIAGRDVSLRQLRRMLSAYHREAPKGGLQFQSHYRAPRLILLKLNDRELQPIPSRYCEERFEDPDGALTQDRTHDHG